MLGDFNNQRTNFLIWRFTKTTDEEESEKEKIAEKREKVAKSIASYVVHPSIVNAIEKNVTILN